MERLSTPKTKPTNGKVDLQTFSQVVARMALANRMSTQSYGGDRDIYEALGYPTKIEYLDYMARYQRQDIAKAIIDRPVRMTWQGDLEIEETGKSKETELERAFRLMGIDLKLKTCFARVDRLACIGRYAVLLLGTDDLVNIESFKTPLSKTKKHKLVYVQPYGENNAAIKEWETDVRSPRYGHPKIYEIQFVDTQSNTQRVLLVHYSRVIHVVTDVLESDVLGTPVLESVFNRLMDIEKIVGGDGEMFWRGARPGYAGSVKPDFQMTDEGMTDLMAQITEYEHNVRRFLVNEGVDLQALAQQIADPRSHLDVQVQMICAVTGIPKRVLMGSERGELSSTQDQGEWLSYVQARRGEHAEPHIVRPFIDMCIEYGMLPKPKKDMYDIHWEDLFSLSEKERVEIGEIRAKSLKEYSTNLMAEIVMPRRAFYEFGLGLTLPQIELIEELHDEAVTEEGLGLPTEEELKQIEEEKNNGADTGENTDTQPD